MRELEIYPKKEMIYGWESPKSIESVISLMVGMIEGDKIPSVILHTFDEGKTFEIAYMENGKSVIEGRGGHHRLIGASLLDDSLNVNIKGFAEKIDCYLGVPQHKKLIEIKDIRLASIPSFCATYKRPLPSVDEFFTKYKEINRALKYACKDYSFTRGEYKKLLNSLR